MTTLPLATLPPQETQPFQKWIRPAGIVIITGILALGIIVWIGGQFMAQRSPGQPGLSPVVPAASIAPAAITDTPAQAAIPPTATVPVSNQSLDFLEDVQVLSTDTFDDPLGSGWGMDAGRIENGVMEIPGNENWNGASRNGAFGEYQGVVIDFNYSTDSLFEVFVDNGDWDTDEYRRFGVYIGSNNVQTNQYAGRNDLGGADVAGNLTLKPGTNYSLSVAILPDGELLEAIWNPSNPSERFFYREQLDETWAGLTWTFWIGVNRGTVQFDNFKRIKFSSAR